MSQPLHRLSVEQVSVAFRDGTRFPIERVMPAAEAATVLWLAVFWLGREIARLI